MYARTVGRRGAVVAGLLHATSLLFIVTATSIGVSIDAIRPFTAAALVAAGLLSVVLFPLIALAVSRGAPTTTIDIADADADAATVGTGAVGGHRTGPASYTR